MANDDTEATLTGTGKRQERSLADLEIEETLRHCEQLLGQVNNGIRQIVLAEAVAIILVAIVPLAALLSVLDSSNKPESAAAALIGIVIVWAAIAVAASQLIARIRRQVRRDELVMVSIVNTQRERIPLLSRREEWSPARRVFMQQRLDRFPIDVNTVRGHRIRVNHR